MKILVMVMLLLTSTVQAEEVAQVMVIRGDVTANGSTLVQGSGVNEGDTLAAGAKSFAVLRFVDGANVTLRPNSVLRVEEYAYMQGDEPRAHLSLVQGGLRILTGAIAKQNPEAYALQTPVALMGVRGTEFSIYLLP